MGFYFSVVLHIILTMWMMFLCRLRFSSAVKGGARFLSMVHVLIADMRNWFPGSCSELATLSFLPHVLLWLITKTLYFCYEN